MLRVEAGLASRRLYRALDDAFEEERGLKNAMRADRPSPTGERRQATTAGS